MVIGDIPSQTVDRLSLIFLSQAPTRGCTLASYPRHSCPVQPRTHDSIVIRPKGPVVSIACSVRSRRYSANRFAEVIFDIPRQTSDRLSSTFLSEPHTETSTRQVILDILAKLCVREQVYGGYLRYSSISPRQVIIDIPVHGYGSSC